MAVVTQWVNCAAVENPNSSQTCRQRRQSTAVFRMIRQDVVYALRTMRSDKLTSLIAILVLALGIGSTATIFKLVNGLLLHPLPFPQQERLLYVEESDGKAGGISGAVAFPNYLDLCSRN